jgi:hypothetical protein
MHFNLGNQNRFELQILKDNNDDRWRNRKPSVNVKSTYDSWNAVPSSCASVFVFGMKI